jgi:hypothetical protein
MAKDTTVHAIPCKMTIDLDALPIKTGVVTLQTAIKPNADSKSTKMTLCQVASNVITYMESERKLKLDHSKQEYGWCQRSDAVEFKPREFPH